MRNKILGIDKRSHMLIGIFQQHNDEIKPLLAKIMQPQRMSVTKPL